MRVVVCDNYDSFTYNLVQYLGSLGVRVDVVRNDEVSVDDIADTKPDGVVISPGPGEPSAAGISVGLVRRCERTRTPLLGVCLGHQAIGAAFGVPTVRAPAVMHGKSSVVHHDGCGVFNGLRSPLDAGRYHSLVVDSSGVRDPLVVTARTVDGVVMGLRHIHAPIEGVQFHPESVLTPDGLRIVENFVRVSERRYSLPT